MGAGIGKTGGGKRAVAASGLPATRAVSDKQAGRGKWAAGGGRWIMAADKPPATVGLRLRQATPDNKLALRQRTGAKRYAWVAKTQDAALSV